MRRAQLLSILMFVALAAVLVTVLATTMRRAADVNADREAASEQEQQDAGEAERKVASNGSAPAAEAAGPASGGEEPAPSSTAPEEEPEGPTGPFIRRVDLNGQDLADLLDLSLWKYAFRIPENEYTLYFWVERWTRNAEKPVVRELTSISGVWAENEIVLKLPTDQDQRFFFRIGDVIKRSTDIDPLRPPTPWRRETLREARVQPGRDIYLITYTHNELETSTRGRINVHRQNDKTIYVKMRFTPGPFVPFDPERITSEYY